MWFPSIWFLPPFSPAIDWNKRQCWLNRGQPNERTPAITPSTNRRSNRKKRMYSSEVSCHHYDQSLHVTKVCNNRLSSIMRRGGVGEMLTLSFTERWVMIMKHGSRGSDFGGEGRWGQSNRWHKFNKCDSACPEYLNGSNLTVWNWVTFKNNKMSLQCAS